ncbi:YwaF family protein [Streptococcus dentasini]
MGEFFLNFFTTVETQPPTITGFWYLMILMGIVVLIGLTVCYHKSSAYVNFFKWLQIVQLLVLYSWYLVCHIPLANSLPLYHCRLAMVGLVLLPNKFPLKHYLALMGVGGAFFALGYPVPDPYTFPHITGVSFFIGHFALLVNGLAYLLNYFQVTRFSLARIVGYTFVLDLFLLWVNHLTGGNYGLMRFTPIIDNSNVWVNYVVVSAVFSLALVLVELSFRRWKKA